MTRVQVAPCTCGASWERGVVIMHAVPEVLFELVDAINRGDIRNQHGARITVEVVSHAEYAENHADLQFTSHYDKDWEGE